MHVENALVEFVTTGEQEYEEVIEEYEKEVFVQEEASEPSTTDIADHPPTQGKPWCITFILNMWQNRSIYTRSSTVVLADMVTRTYIHLYKPGSPSSVTKDLDKSTSQPRSRD